MLSNEKSSTVFSKHQKLWQPEFTVIENVRFYLQKRVTKFLKWQQYILRDLLKHLITKMETYKLETCNRHLPQSNLNGMYFSCFHSWKLQILYSTHSPWIFNSAFLKVTRVANNPNTNYYIKKVQLKKKMCREYPVPTPQLKANNGTLLLLNLDCLQKLLNYNRFLKNWLLIDVQKAC